MRKLLSYAMAAMLALGFASCSSEDNFPGDGKGGETGAVSFTIEMPKGAYNPVTYSDGGIANNEEWNIASIDIYAFESNGTYIKKLVDGTDYRQSVTGDHKWRIIVDQDFVLDYEFKSVHFYFVGNDATSMQGAHIADDWDGTEAEFKNLLTNSLEVTAEKAEQIAINGTDANLLFSGVARNVYMGGKVSKGVTLKRREARFDILNDNANVELHRVWIYNANIQGYIFADATDNADLETADLESIDLSTIELNDETNMWESVFYLYPTELSMENTQIVLAATIEGEDKIFNLGSKVMVEANKRYKLILDKSSLTFNIEVVDYDEGEELPIGQEEGEVTFDLTHAQFDGKVFDINSVTGNFTVTVNSIHGTRAEVIYHLGAPADLTDPAYEIDEPTSVVSYSYGTEDTYEITIPKRKPGLGNFVNMEVRFVSVVDDTKSASFYFRSLNGGIMPAYKGFLAYEGGVGGAGLNIDGKGKLLYFTSGSLIGLNPDATSITKNGIVWAPEGYDLDALKSLVGSTTGNALIGIIPGTAVVSEMPDENNVKAGIGDPCKELKDKSGQTGGYRMPLSAREGLDTFVWDDKKVGWSANNGEYLLALSGQIYTGVQIYTGKDGYGRIYKTVGVIENYNTKSYTGTQGNNGNRAVPVRCIRAE